MVWTQVSARIATVLRRRTTAGETVHSEGIMAFLFRLVFSDDYHGFNGDLRNCHQDRYSIQSSVRLVQPIEITACLPLGRK